MGNKKRIEAFRDGVLHYTEGEIIETPEAIVEVLFETKTSKEKIYFAEIKETVLCAHGSSIEDAIEEARFKGGIRSVTETEMKQYREPDYKFSVGVFRRLTGACKVGIDNWLKQKRLPSNIRMTLAEFKAADTSGWASQLERALRGTD